MLGSVYVECEEDNCIYNGNGRCIAERISMMVYADGHMLTCDTYEDRELAYDPDWPDPFEDEHDDWGDRD